MKTSVALVILAGVLFSSCSQSYVDRPSNNSTSKSEVAIGLSMKDAPSNVSMITGILSRQGYDTLTQAFAVSGDSATCEFYDVPVGTWHLVVDAYNAQNSLQYTGSANIQVEPGRVTPVSLTLDQPTGSISITVTWGIQDTTSTNMAVEFDGRTGYVTFPGAADLHPRYCTVEFKVWFDSTGAGPYPLLCPTNEDLYTQADGYEIYEEDGNMGFAVAVDSTLGEPVVHQFTVPYRKWVDLAGTYDGQYLSLYIDGQLVAKSKWSSPIWYGQNGFCLGKMYHSDIFPGVFYFKGAIDGLKIWNYAMTQAQIDSTMNAQLTGNEPGLIGYWNFNQTVTSTYVPDRTGNGNNGRLVGGVKFVPVSSLPVE